MNSLHLTDDELSPYFAPLLAGLSAGRDGGILVAGGYGLFLKQRWLLDHHDVQSIVPMDQWRDTAPRVTKDLDLVVSLDLLADAAVQEVMVEMLEKNGFKVSEKNPRWQFIKELSAIKKIVVELHAPKPPPDAAAWHADRIRVKHKPSLGEHGVHARTNAEAVGSTLQPFQFEVQGMAVQVPNPITWSIMKITASDDRWQTASDPAQSEEFRSFSRAQAIKHAQDVCRVVAMTTRGESDATAGVIAALRETPEFQRAAAIVTASFAHDDQWISQNISEHWNPDSFTLIRRTLSGWFVVAG